MSRKYKFGDNDKLYFISFAGETPTMLHISLILLERFRTLVARRLRLGGEFI